MTCGDNGGKKANGGPCGRRVKEGRCRDHQESAEQENQDQKERFLELLATGDHSKTTAAEEIGVSRVTAWRWEQSDPDFKADVAGLLEVVDDIRMDQVEHSTFKRILSGSAPASLHIFWMINRGGGRWRDVRHIFQSTFDFDMDDLEDHELERIKQGEDPLKVLLETRGKGADTEAPAA